MEHEASWRSIVYILLSSLRRIVNRPVVSPAKIFFCKGSFFASLKKKKAESKCPGFIPHAVMEHSGQGD